MSAVKLSPVSTLGKNVFLSAIRQHFNVYMYSIFIPCHPIPNLHDNNIIIA